MSRPLMGWAPATLVQALAGDDPPGFEACLAALAPIIDLLGRLAETPQDPRWHGEGDVAVHTALVLDALERELSVDPPPPDTSGAAGGAARLSLRLGALLHDIGKPLTTRSRERDGVRQLVAPRHAARGASYLAFRLAGMGLDPEVYLAVMALVRHHHDPVGLVVHDRPAGAFQALARRTDPRRLLTLCRADLRGRRCDDLEQQLELLELFRAGCEACDAWEPARLHGDLVRRIAGALAGAPLHRLERCLMEGIRDLEAGAIHTPEEALARERHRAGGDPGRPPPALVVTCGPSGSGKSSWIARRYPGRPVVSLDAIRLEVAGRRDDQRRNRQVVRLAHQRLGERLRAGEAVVWDATALRHDLRRTVLQLGRDHGAHTTLAVFCPPRAVIEARNQRRDEAIPSGALRRQLEGYQWPDLDEAHRVIHLDELGATLGDTRRWWQERCRGSAEGGPTRQER